MTVTNSSLIDIIAALLLDISETATKPPSSFTGATSTIALYHKRTNLQEMVTDDDSVKLSQASPRKLNAPMTPSRHSSRLSNGSMSAVPNDIILNLTKFNLAKITIKFVGLEIIPTTVRPWIWYLEAIHGFLTPKNITDICSWFGLISLCFCWTNIAIPVTPQVRHLVCMDKPAE